MYKRIVYIVLSTLLIFSLNPKAISNASIKSKNDFIKLSSLDWMYKNTHTTIRTKMKKEMVYKQLNEIYTRVMRERFGEVKLSIIRVESAFDNNAIGKTRELCMMQINPIWRNELKKLGIIKNWLDLRDMGVCITAGSFIFDYYYEKYGDVEKAIEAYNGGGDPNYKKKILLSLGSLKISHLEAIHNYNLLNGIKDGGAHE